jgi:esterase/lipase superfamily enzyme
VVNRGQGPRAGFVSANGPLVVEGVDTIDVTAASTAILALNHSTYAESPELLAEIEKLLHGIRPPDKLSPALTQMQGTQGPYWKVGR